MKKSILMLVLMLVCGWANACVNPTDGGMIAGNQSGCTAFDPVLITSTAAPSGHSGVLEYKWQISTTSSSSGFSDIANSNAETYDPGILSQTTWYKRIARVDCMSDWISAAESNVLKITVNPLPVLADPSDQVVCNGAATANVTFTGTVTGTAFNWTNDNPSIGLAANGTGDIASFTAANTTNAPVTATVTVTPSTGGSFAYISNELSNSVSVINTSTNTVVATIPVGSDPRGVAVSPDGSKVYVTISGSNTVAVISTATNTVVATVMAGNGPIGIAISPDGSRLFVTNYSYNTVTVINTSTNAVVATIPVGSGPLGIEVSPDGSKLYVANLYDHNVYIIDTNNYALIETVNLGFYTIGITVSPDGSRVYVSSWANNIVAVINTATNTIMATITVERDPFYLSISPDGSRVYTSNSSANSVSVINTSTNSVVTTIPVGSHPGGISVSPDGSKVYVTNFKSNTVSVISTATNSVIATVDVGTGPYSMGNFITGGSGPACTGESKTFTITVSPSTGVTSFTAGAETVCQDAADETYTATATNSTSIVYSVLPVIAGSIDAANGLMNWDAAFSGTATITATSTGLCGTTNATRVVTVNPLPVVTAGTYGPVCIDAADIILSGNPAGGVWSGTGVTGNLFDPSTRTQTLTYTYTDANTCVNAASTTITVNPLPTVDDPADQVVCNGTATANVTFTGAVMGTNFNWTNDNPSIGLPANGTGDIASFTAANTTNSPVTATVTVTPYAGSGGSFAYISNGESDNVSVINTATNAVVATIAVGPNPVGVSVSPDGNRVYVAVSYSYNVSVINTSTNTLVASVGVGNNPFGVSVSPDGSRVYVANRLSNNVSVINTSTNTVVATIAVGSYPYGISVSPDGNLVYVTNHISNNISVISTSTNTVVATIAVGSSPQGVSVSPDGSWAYVTNTNSNNISVINTSANTVAATIAVGDYPTGISVSPDGGRVYVTNYYSNNVSVINTSTNTVVANIDVANPYGISVSPDGSRVYVANHLSNDVLVINTSTNAIVATVKVGSYPVAFGNFITGGSGPACTGESKTFTLTVNPTPTIVCPTNDIVNTDPGTCYARKTFSATAAGTPAPTVSYSISGSPIKFPYDFPLGNTTVDVTAHNDCSPDATCSFTVTVQDGSLPVLGGIPEDASVSCDAIPLSGTPTATDNCDAAPVVHYLGEVSTKGTNPLLPAYYNYTLTRTWDATDATGNHSLVGTQVITVKDAMPPVISNCPPDIMVNTGDGRTSCDQIVSWTPPTATDNCSPVSGVSNHHPNDVFPKGTTSVTYTFKDVTGNSTDCTFTITVIDNTVPTIACASGSPFKRNTNTGVCSYKVVGTEFNPISFSDNCPGSTIKNNFNNTASLAGALLPKGSNVIEWTVTDAWGNNNVCSIIVNVEDHEIPSITCSPSTYTATFDPTVCGFSYAVPNTIIGDNCGTVTQIWSITRNSIVEASGSGNVGTYTFGIGTSTIDYLVTDGSSNTNTCSKTVIVNTLSVSPELTVTPGTQQYSDMVEFKVVIPNGVSTCGNAAASAIFTVSNGGSQTMGTANFVAIGTDLEATINSALFEIPNSVVMAPGVKTVSAVLNGLNSSIYVVGIPASKPLTINQEDARVTFTGTQLVATQSSTSSLATVTLRATIQDITATSDAGGDPDFGDIRKAKVRFLNNNVPIVISGFTDANGWVLSGITLVNSADTKTGVVTVNWPVNINSSSDMEYTIGIEVSGYYARNSAADNTVITVYKPVGDFITGGGYIIPTGSAGTYPAAPNLKTNFGFNVKYNKTGKNLQGNMNLLFRSLVGSVVHTYQIKANAMTSLGVNISNPLSQTAVFVSKANLTDITNPLSPVSLGGNLTLQVNMTDNGEPGVNDKIAISLWSGSTLMYSSNWTGSKSEEKLLGGGNLVVHSGFNLTPAATSNLKSTDMDMVVIEVPVLKNELKVYPNPASGLVTFEFRISENAKVTLDISSISGQRIAVIFDADVEADNTQTVFFNESLAPGVYLYTLRWKDQVITGKLIRTK